MRTVKAVYLAALGLVAGMVQASSQSASLRVSLTIIERCDISGGASAPSVECSTGVPWTIATSLSDYPDSQNAAEGRAPHPVPVADKTGPGQGGITAVIF